VEDANLVTELLKHKDMEAYNSRVFKTVENGTPSYEVRFLFIDPFCGTHLIITIQDCFWKLLYSSIVVRS